MALGEVGVSLPWWCHALVLPAPGYGRLFKISYFFHNGQMTSFRGILGQSWNSEVSAILPYEILPFNFDFKFCWNWSFFHYELWDLKKSSVTWSWKDKGVASSWKSHAHFSWGQFTNPPYLHCHPFDADSLKVVKYPMLK